MSCITSRNHIPETTGFRYSDSWLLPTSSFLSVQQICELRLVSKHHSEFIESSFDWRQITKKFSFQRITSSKCALDCLRSVSRASTAIVDDPNRTDLYLEASRELKAVNPFGCSVALYWDDVRSCVLESTLHSAGRYVCYVRLFIEYDKDVRPGGSYWVYLKTAESCSQRRQFDDPDFNGKGFVDLRVNYIDVNEEDCPIKVDLVIERYKPIKPDVRHLIIMSYFVKVIEKSDPLPQKTQDEDILVIWPKKPFFSKLHKNIKPYPLIDSTIFDVLDVFRPFVTSFCAGYDASYRGTEEYQLDKYSIEDYSD